VVGFAAWCEQEARITALHDIEPVHVAAYMEALQARLKARQAAPGRRQSPRPACAEQFDWAR
jgi:hypothetical protein